MALTKGATTVLKLGGVRGAKGAEGREPKARAEALSIEASRGAEHRGAEGAEGGGVWGGGVPLPTGGGGCAPSQKFFWF